MASGVTISVQIKTNKLPQMMARLPRETSAVLRTGALRGIAYAIANAPVDTGTLKNSIAGEGMTAGSLSMVIFTSVGYGAYVNFGTRYMAAQPFFTQAAREVERSINTGLNGLVGRLL